MKDEKSGHRNKEENAFVWFLFIILLYAPVALDYQAAAEPNNHSCFYLLGLGFFIFDYLKVF